jgi:alkanesulfonate monooxygenase SsuD/methylene tetrahydromethanopterin reductase-like flavin-dependent oxidoreductase (luciferase family)
MWNAWHAWFGNTPKGLARMMEQIDSLCREVGRDPSEVARTVAVMVQAPGGIGRVYGDSEHEGSDAVSGSPAAVAEALHAFAAVGVDHVQLVVDPITLESIEWLAPALALLDAG